MFDRPQNRLLFNLPNSRTRNFELERPVFVLRLPLPVEVHLEIPLGEAEVEVYPHPMFDVSLMICSVMANARIRIATTFVTS